MRASRVWCRLLCLVGVVGIGLPAPAAEEITVLLMPVENLSGDTGLEASTETIRTTLRLNLQLLSGFHAKEYHDLPIVAAHDTAARQTIMREHEADNIVFIRIEPGVDTGAYLRIRAVVYAAAADGDVTVETEAQATTLFEIFTAADQVTEALLSGLLGRPVEYGSIEIHRLGRPSRYRVHLNDQFVGESLSSIPTVVAGSYDLRITQQRLFGEELLYENLIEVPSGSTTTVSFELPGLTQSEQAHFRDIDTRIRAAHRQSDHPAALDWIQETITALDTPETLALCPSYGELLQRYRQLQDYVAGSGPVLLDSSPDQFWVPDSNTYLHINNLLPVSRLPAGQRLRPVSRLVDRYHSIPFREIAIDGEFSDWEGIGPVIVGSGARPFRAEQNLLAGLEIEAVYLARDDRNLYMRYVIADADIPSGHLLTREREPSYKLHFRESSRQIGLQMERVGQEWWTQVFEWNNLSRSFTELGRGRSRITGNSFEASFPLHILNRELQLGRTYGIDAVTMTIDRRVDHHHPTTAYHQTSSVLVY